MSYKVVLGPEQSQGIWSAVELWPGTGQRSCLYPVSQKRLTHGLCLAHWGWG